MTIAAASFAESALAVIRGAGMICQQLSNQELIDLHAHALRLASGSDISGVQHSNLLLLLQMVDEELCARCELSTAAECALSDPRPECRHIATERCLPSR